MNYEFLLRFCVCFLISFLIGIERQYRRRIIGLRTTILVSVGCFLFVTFSFSIGASDISRIASGVVTGIGFLGAGVILKDGKKVTGLTTAATLWCVAAIGTLCAGGALYEASIGGIIILFSNIVLRYINKLVNDISSENNSYENYELKIKCSLHKEKSIGKYIQDFYNTYNVEVVHLSIYKDLNEVIMSYEFKILEKNKNKLEEFMYSFETLKVKSFELKKVVDSKQDEFDN